MLYIFLMLVGETECGNMKCRILYTDYLKFVWNFIYALYVFMSLCLTQNQVFLCWFLILKTLLRVFGKIYSINHIFYTLNIFGFILFYYENPIIFVLWITSSKFLVNNTFDRSILSMLSLFLAADFNKWYTLEWSL